MNINRLTLPILSLHFLIDKGEKYAVGDVYQQIDDGSIFQKIVDKYGEKYPEIRMDGLKIAPLHFPNDYTELVEALQRLANAELSETFGVDDDQNGLLFLAGLLNELIQQSDIEIDFK